MTQSEALTPLCVDSFNDTSLPNDPQLSSTTTTLDDGQQSQGLSPITRPESTVVSGDGLTYDAVNRQISALVQSGFQPPYRKPREIGTVRN